MQTIGFYFCVIKGFLSKHILREASNFLLNQYIFIYINTFISQLQIFSLKYLPIQCIFPDNTYQFKLTQHSCICYSVMNKYNAFLWNWIHIIENNISEAITLYIKSAWCSCNQDLSFIFQLLLNVYSHIE